VVLIIDLCIHVASVRSGYYRCGRLVVGLGPRSDLDLGMHRLIRAAVRSELQYHKQPRVPLKARLDKWTRYYFRVMGQQLGFDAMDAGRLLERLDDVGQKVQFHFSRVWQSRTVRNVQIADHALASFIDEKGVAEDATAIDRSVSRQDLGIDIAENHLRGA